MIENAIGGSGDDTFTGNEADNTFDGGAGTDTALFALDYSQYTIAYVSADYTVVSSDSGGTDTFYNTEYFDFNGSDYYWSSLTVTNLTAYYFYWYSPNSGDYYYGTVYDDGSYGYYAGEVDYGPYSTTESGSGDGYYYIYSSADASGSGYAAGYVVVGTTYYDGDTGTTMSTWYGQQGYATGAYGLGSEYDYAHANSGTYDIFGGDYYEADNTNLTAYYFYWYSPNSGDYYYGTVYDDGTYGYYAGEVVYGPYSSTESGSGDGYYYIYSSAGANGSGYAVGNVVTDSTYYDGNSGTLMSTW